MKMKACYLSCLLAGTSFAWIASAGAVYAQAPSTPASASSKGQIEEIVVTAEKRSSTAQNTPGTVVAISGEQLAEQGISGVSQLAAIVPSAQFQVLRSQVQVFIRGVGQNNSGPNADPAVATNLNGIYQLSDMTGAAFFDLERVEVLPGPQGTLYGRNAAGGAVNVISRRPGDIYGGNASIEVGAYNTLNAQAGIDLPLSDTFAVRAAAGLQRHDGYLSNGGDDKDTKTFRLTGVYKPTERATLTVIGSYTRNDGIGDQVVNIPPVRSSDPWYFPFPASKLGLFNRDNFYTLSAEFDYQLTDHLKFTYLGGYDNFDRHQFLILDGTPSPLAVQTQDIAQDGRFFSHEARLTGDYGRLQWIAGLYYYDSVQNYDNHVVLPPVVVVQQGPIRVNGNGIAAFGQLTYSLENWLRLTGGLRYSHDEKDGGGPYTVTVAGTQHPSPFTGKLKTNHVDWKAGIEADVAPHSLLYANVQTGYNQGGFSFAPPAAVGGDNTYKPEELTAYTIGNKNRFLDQRLQFNVEAYYYDYSNYQISARDLRSSLNIIYNAQSAQVYGAQIDTLYLVTDNDRVSADLGLLHAEANKLILPASAGGANLSGYQLPDSPDLTVSASYEHDWELASGGLISGKVSESFIGQRWSAYNHPTGTHLPSYHKTDVSLTYTPASGKWSIQAWARNLENEAVWDSAVSSNLPGPAAGFIQAPRTYGMRLTANF